MADTPPPAYRPNPLEYIMAIKATLPINGNATAKFGLAPLHDMYRYEDRRFDLVWSAPLMGTLYGSNLKVDLGPLAQGDYTLAFGLFYLPVDDFTLNATPHDEPIAPTRTNFSSTGINVT